MKTTSILRYIVLLPAFFLGYTLLYDSFDLCEYYNFHGFSYTFHLLMLTCILLGVVSISRGISMFILPKKNLNYWHYAFYCALEVFASACFMALYTCLFANEPYFKSLAFCLKYNYLILVFPISIHALLNLVLSHKTELQLDKNQLGKAADPDSLVRFHDEHHRLKFMIDAKAILYIKAEDNYIQIYYLDNGKKHHYELRNSMKSIEKSMAANKILRCHRSYYVNPIFIKVLRKDPEGFIFADMSVNDGISVPISKKYYEEIASIL